uniref:Uncharacterized protein n=1 Tax=Opuntia streptacantha TaxID=393608 RepID=A0A7C9EPU6_OPUST
MLLMMMIMTKRKALVGNLRKPLAMAMQRRETYSLSLSLSLSLSCLYVLQVIEELSLHSMIGFHGMKFLAQRKTKVLNFDHGCHGHSRLFPNPEHNAKKTMTLFEG